MLTDLRQYSSHYAILAGWLALMIILFLFFYPNTEMAILVVLLTGFGYSLWGFTHHYLLGDLTAKIMAEYVLASMVVMTILAAALKNR